MDKNKGNQKSDLEHIKHSKETEPIKSAEELEKEAELTEEDMEALGPEDLSMDLGDDEQLKQRVDPVDFDGTELDIPGRSLDDDQESRGAEDEENNHYSLGSDDNDNLERGEP